MLPLKSTGRLESVLELLSLLEATTSLRTTVTGNVQSLAIARLLISFLFIFILFNINYFLFASSFSSFRRFSWKHFN